MEQLLGAVQQGLRALLPAAQQLRLPQDQGLPPVPVQQEHRLGQQQAAGEEHPGVGRLHVGRVAVAQLVVEAAAQQHGQRVREDPEVGGADLGLRCLPELRQLHHLQPAAVQAAEDGQDLLEPVLWKTGEEDQRAAQLGAFGQQRRQVIEHGGLAGAQLRATGCPAAAGQTCRGMGVAWKDWSSCSSMARTQARRSTMSGPSSSPSSSSSSRSRWAAEARRWGSRLATSLRDGLRLPLRIFWRLGRLIPEIFASAALATPLSSTRLLRYWLNCDIPGYPSCKIFLDTCLDTGCFLSYYILR